MDVPVLRCLARARDTMSSLDSISLENVAVECIIGLFREERVQPQPVSVNLRLGLSPFARSRRDLGDTIDYLSVAGQVRFLLSACRFYLIETAAEALASYLLAPPA